MDRYVVSDILYFVGNHKYLLVNNKIFTHEEATSHQANKDLQETKNNSSKEKIN